MCDFYAFYCSQYRTLKKRLAKIYMYYLYFYIYLCIIIFYAFYCSQYRTLKKRFLRYLILDIFKIGHFQNWTFWVFLGFFENGHFSKTSKCRFFEAFKNGQKMPFSKGTPLKRDFDFLTFQKHQLWKKVDLDKR